MSEFSPADRAYVRRYLEEKFNLSELKTLSFDLGLDYEMLAHGTKPEFAREMVAYFERKGGLSSLVQGVIRDRPDDNLAQILARIPAADGVQKVQLILSNDRIQSKPDLRQKLADLLGIPMDEVMLIATAAGSLKLLLGLPPEAVLRLQTLNLPYYVAEYEIIAVEPFLSLPPEAREAWRSQFVKEIGGVAGAAAKSGAAGLLGKILLWFFGIVALILLVGGGATAIWWQNLPRLSLVNNCGRTLPLPPQVPEFGRRLLGLPPEIPPGGTINFPLVSGRGTYRLEVHDLSGREVVVLALPRSLPIVNRSQFELGLLDPTIHFRVDGELVEMPTRFVVAGNQPHELILCADLR